MYRCAGCRTLRSFSGGLQKVVYFTPYAAFRGFCHIGPLGVIVLELFPYPFLFLSEFFVFYHPSLGCTGQSISLPPPGAVLRIGRSLPRDTK
ncbi:hypothetical protein ACRRTK_006801 [Alexandromys fortis]